ncbi:YlmC/YmxH family sporulation protein [Clostridium cylindrosporum]|uniref:Putative PRC-barrel domain protein n=1 Tax=Clostridium cylindrosporum DSM 605 TaxID=1121307 RepID=A0A0J8D6D8_CLOCY|nr:YlmC/YmxH family sporulation protein [Clostridium cylindrosporum]KMT21417.1 putative PRC-barrel domain protein [Clostridium cylindrosporum DSM 605]
MDLREEKNKLLLSELKSMEVIDISEGKRLGFIGDIIFDEDLTYIKSFVIPYQSGIFSVFKKREELEIKWEQIKVIGVDIMLVDLLNENANVD